MLLISCSLIFLFVGQLVLVPPAIADGLEMSPPLVELEMSPGSERTFDISITNTSEFQSCRLKVSISPVAQDRRGNIILTETSQWSAVPWMTLESNSMVIEPKASNDALVKVKVPRGMSGTRAAAVVFELMNDETQTSSQEDALGGSITFKYRIISIVKITVKNNANRLDASIEGLTVLSPLDKRYGQYGDKAVAVVCTVVNEGNTAFNSNGWLLIRDSEKRRVKESPMGSGLGIILPGSTIDLVSIFPAGLPPGQYSLQVDVQYGTTRPLRATIPFEISDNKASQGEAIVRKAVRLSVTPEFMNSQVPRGAFRTFMLNLTNRDNYPLEVGISNRDLVSFIDGTFEASDTTNGKYAAKDWLNIPENRVSLLPGEKKNVKVNMIVPKDALEGTYYAALHLEAIKKDSEKSDAISLYDVPLTASIGKSLTKKASIAEVWLEKPDATSPMWICGELINQGNTHFVVSGSIIISKRETKPQLVDGMEYLGEMEYQEIEMVQLGETKGWVLPGTSLTISIPYEKRLEPGEYQAEIIVNIGDKLPVRNKVLFKIGK